MKFGCSELFFEHLPRVDSCERFDIVFGFLHKDYAVSCPCVNQLTVTTELARFPGDLPADPRHVLVNEDPRTLQFPSVSHDRTLGVVAGERGDYIARCRLVVRRPPGPVGAHDVMGVDLHAEFRRRQLTDNSVGLLAGFLWNPPNPDDVSTRILLSSSSHFSSSSLTLVFSALISESFLAISKSNLLLRRARPSPLLTGLTGNLGCCHGRSHCPIVSASYRPNIMSVSLKSLILVVGSLAIHHACNHRVLGIESLHCRNFYVDNFDYSRSRQKHVLPVPLQYQVES